MYASLAVFKSGRLMTGHPFVWLKRQKDSIVFDVDSFHNLLLGVDLGAELL